MDSFNEDFDDYPDAADRPLNSWNEYIQKGLSDELLNKYTMKGEPKQRGVKSYDQIYCEEEAHGIWVPGYRKKDGTLVKGYCKNGFNY